MRTADTRLTQQLGSSVTYVALEPVGAATFRYFAEAVGDLDPRYLSAPNGGAEDVPTAPPTLLFETNQYTGRRPDANGYSGHTWDGIPATAVWIRGGNEYRLGRPVRPSDRLKVTWTLVGVRDVTTREGREMIQVTSEADFRSTDGDWLGWTRETMFLADPEPADA